MIDRLADFFFLVIVPVVFIIALRQEILASKKDGNESSCRSWGRPSRQDGTYSKTKRGDFNP